MSSQSEQQQPRRHLSQNLEAHEQAIPLDEREQATIVEKLDNISSSIVVPQSLRSGRLNPRSVAIGTDHTSSPELRAGRGNDNRSSTESSSPLSRAGPLKELSKAFLQYLKTPLGIIFGIYGLLVVVWGAALVIIIAGWTPMTEDTKAIWVEICSQVLNGLFTLTGIGFIPWRVRDAWHMSVICRYRRKAAKLRKRQQASLSAGRLHACQSLTDAETVENAVISQDPDLFPTYLRFRESQRLIHSEKRFKASQSWYRYQETADRTTVPVGLALMITCLVVGNSIFQCFLCGVMWGYDRHTRPPWTTGLGIAGSFLCGLGAAGLIWWVGKKTKKPVLYTDGDKDTV